MGSGKIICLGQKEMFTKRLSQFIAGTNYDDLSSETVTTAKKANLDHIGVAMAGSQEPPGKIVNEYVRERECL